MRAALLSLALLAGCSLTPRDGQFTCPDRNCPAGFVCGSDGLCHVAGLDAPPIDAPTPDVPGLDAPELDAPELDAPDAPRDVPARPETCAPGPRRVPVDEDLDGRIDEDCGYFFGTPHAVIPAMPVQADYYGAALTSNGLSLFVVPTTATSFGNTVHVSRRADLFREFGVAVSLASTGRPDRRLDAVTVRGDGGELIMQQTGTDEESHLVSSTSSGASWSAPSALVGVLPPSGSEDVQPWLRADGLELFFVRRATAAGSATSIYTSRRDSLGEAWSSPVELGPGYFPSLSPDGYTLYFRTGATDEAYVERSSLDESFVLTGGASTLPHPTSARVFVRPAFHPAGREVFFGHGATSATVPDEAPRVISLFRMQVCRDGPCPDVRITECSGVLSGDGLHCYVEGVSNTRPAVLGVCTAPSHTVSVHSLREAGEVRILGSDGWLGLMGTSWDSGEPFLYEEFGGALPTSSQCSLTGAGWPIVSCAEVHPVICERDLWPVFVDP